MILDELVFQTIVTRYRKSVYRQALRMLRDEGEAEEATQDIFLKIYHNIQDLQADGSIWNWIHRVTVNACVSRRRGPRPEVESLDDLDPDIPDAEQDLEQAYGEAELKRVIQGSLSFLPPNQAAALSLFYYENKSIEEIAAIMNTEYNTAASYIHRGRNKLHTLLVKTFQEDLR